jgi:hypothetical protein
LKDYEEQFDEIFFTGERRLKGVLKKKDELIQMQEEAAARKNMLSLNYSKLGRVNIVKGFY